jgi:hypothetical protein
MELLPKRQQDVLQVLLELPNQEAAFYPLNMEEDNHKIAFGWNVDGVAAIQTIASN